MTAQQILTTLIPLVAALLSYIIQRDHYNAMVNTAIAVCCVLLAVLAAILLHCDVGIVSSLTTALQAYSLIPLQQFLLTKINVPGSGTPPAPSSITTIPQVKPTVADWTASAMGDTTQPQQKVQQPPPPTGGNTSG